MRSHFRPAKLLKDTHTSKINQDVDVEMAEASQDEVEDDDEGDSGDG